MHQPISLCGASLNLRIHIRFRTCISSGARKDRTLSGRRHACQAPRERSRFVQRGKETSGRVIKHEKTAKSAKPGQAENSSPRKGRLSNHEALETYIAAPQCGTPDSGQESVSRHIESGAQSARLLALSWCDSYHEGARHQARLHRCAI